MNRKLTFVSAASLALILQGGMRAADFELSFDSASCGTTVSGSPGEEKIFEIFATLNTTNNTTPDGAQGWSLSIEAVGGTIETASLTGVTVSTIYDRGIPDSDPPATEHLDPYDQALNNPDMFTKIAAKASDPADANKKGAISAIVLKGTEKQVLQPNGIQKVLKLSVKAAVPASGTADVVLKYTNGFKSTVSQPVNNVVTFAGGSVIPVLKTCTITLKPAGADFGIAIVPAGQPAKPSGDFEYIANVAPGEVVVPVDVLLSSSGLPPGDGPQGWSLSIANEACMIVDAVTLTGVTVSTIYDRAIPDSDPPATEHLDPYIQNLSNPDMFTKIAAKASGIAPSPINDPDQKGIISAVVLKGTEKQVLHANASDTVLRINYKITVEAGKTTNCKAFLLNGLKSTTSQPTSNVITYAGGSNPPATTQALIIKLTGTEVTGEGAAFKSGDANNDGKFNIADAVRIVMAVVPSIGPKLLCDASGDADANERLELLDAIYIIDWQFRHGAAPKAPFPGCAKRAGVDEAECPTSYVCTP
jgi:hypothetical protein